MPPRLQPPSRAISSILRIKRNVRPQAPRYYATATAASEIISPPLDHIIPQSHPIRLHPATQPPSFKPAEFRKSQLLRQYASLLHSAPLILLFQHNSLKSTEWVGIRRELAAALQKVDETRAATGQPYEDVAAGVKIQIVQTGIFAAALRVVEYYKPAANGADLTHVLSEAAHEAAVSRKTTHALSPLLSGPLVLLTFPTVSPQHLKAAMSILSPSTPNFPAPMRRGNPGYYDAAVQSGLQKLILMAARVEGKVFDVEGVKWVGSIDGGMDGLRAQLVAMLQSIGGGLTNTLESAAKNLYFTVESRRTMLEEESKADTAQVEEGSKTDTPKLEDAAKAE